MANGINEVALSKLPTPDIIPADMEKIEPSAALAVAPMCGNAARQRPKLSVKMTPPQTKIPIAGKPTVQKFVISKIPKSTKLNTNKKNTPKTILKNNLK